MLECKLYFLKKIRSARECVEGGESKLMRSEYISKDIWQTFLPSMTDANALIIATSIETGMRVGDVVKLHRNNLHTDYIEYVAEKTGKPGKAPCSPKIMDLLRAEADRHGGICFPSRFGANSIYRTRQAVWKNVRKAAECAGIKPHVSPHSARKTFAVELYHKRGIEAVKAALQHGDTLTTNLYALADLQGATYDRDRLIHDVSDEVMSRLASLMRIQGVDMAALDAEVTQQNQAKNRRDGTIAMFCGEDELK